MADEITFQALRNFHSAEFESDYLDGLYYTARANDTLLRLLLPAWEADGRVRIGPYAARAVATGVVEWR
ncbi:MAG TPA: hypothetical protein VK620_37220 [Bradyrhizobium sp.]|nr:hypothetical protein [Bradyrhizobium sp.]